MATDAKEDKLAQLRKLLGELSHEEARLLLVDVESKLDEPEPEEAAETEKPEDEKEYTLETVAELAESFPVSEVPA